MPHRMFSMSRSPALQMVLADTSHLWVHFSWSEIHLSSSLAFPWTHLLKYLGEGRQRKAMDDCRRQQSTKEHPKSPGEGKHSGGSWEEGKPPALDNQRSGVASSQSTTAVPQCPPCPMEVTSAGAKLAEQSRALAHWLLPFPAQPWEQRHLQLVLPWRGQGAGPAQPSSSPVWLSLLPGQWFLFPLAAEQVGEDDDDVSEGTKGSLAEVGRCATAWAGRAGGEGTSGCQSVLLKLPSQRG